MIISTKSHFKFLVKRADAARDRRDFNGAAALYSEALRLSPEHAGVLIQRGHVLKEAGCFVEAEKAYGQALRLRPNDADLALQLGHFYKQVTRFTEAEESYLRAAQLRPGWQEPIRELEALDRHGWRGRRNQETVDDYEFQPDHSVFAQADQIASTSPARLARLVPALAPRRYQDMLFQHPDQVHLRKLGRMEASFWGNRRTLRGAEAIHGFCISSVQIVELQVMLNGLIIHRASVQGGYALPFEQDKTRAQKFVFNTWIDFSVFANGLHSMEVRLLDIDQATHSFHDAVVIASPISEEDYPDSDGLVSISPDDPRPVEQQIRERPSMVRSARRSLFPQPVRNVLVMRTDQLGDMVASVPALQRLRELLPHAHIVGLLTQANVDLAKTLAVFDEVIAVDFPDDPFERRRLMPLDAQETLRQRLETYEFDLAIDLARADVSRELLQLSNARIKYGVGGGDWPWLSADIIFNTHDRWTNHDNTPHSAKVLALIEALGTILERKAPILRRPDLSREIIIPYGIEITDRFVVLHMGARIGFSRWPYYAELARMIVSHTDLKVVIITEDTEQRAAFPPDILASERVLYLDQRLPFDQFDAFLSFATVMVGNDSGPKHLASLRGTQVVTIFSARINWNEWGQENVGVIISRRLPCAGCAILHEPEECGKEFACIADIKPKEVFDAVLERSGCKALSTGN